MAIHRINIVSGLQAGGGVNNLVCCTGFCQTSVVTFVNDHNSDLNITAFDIDSTGFSGASVNVSHINGGSPSFPFFVAEGDTFTMTILFCPEAPFSLSGSWIGNFVTAEHGNDLAWTFNMDCVPFESLLVTSTFDFTDTIIGSINTQCITVNNTSDVVLSIRITTDCLSGFDVIQVPSTVIIPPGTTGQVCLQWTPTEVGQTFDCTGGINGCDDVPIAFLGTSIEAACDCLCCLDVKIGTDGDYLSPSSGFCSEDVLYTKASFLDKKTVTYNMRYQPGLVTGFTLQYNPALFILDCISPFELNVPLPVGYYIQYLSGAHPDGVAQEMILNGATTNALNLKNWEVYFRPIDAANGYFNVEFTFYLIQDYENFITNLTWNNSTKLRRTTLSSTSDWTNTLTSVYNTNKKHLTGGFRISDPATLVEDSPFACNQIVCSNFAARFYNRGLNNGASEFLFPEFTFSRANGVVNNFSLLEPTRINFKIVIPSIYGTSAPVIVYHLFDTSINDNSVDFLTATDSSRYRVLNYGGTGVLDNHLFEPGIGPYLTSSGWQCSLYAGTNLNATSVYRVAAIVYASDGEVVNTFLSEEIRVTRFPDMDCDCKPDVDSNFVQYWQKTNTECFQPVAKERIGHQLTLTAGDFTNCLADLGIVGFEFPRQLTSVRLKIYKRKENFPSAGQITFFEYQTHYSERNPAFPGAFQNFNNLIVSDNGTEVFTNITDIRIPWEYIPFQPGQVTTANANTYLNRTPAGGMTNSYISGASMLQSWTNEDVYFEYTFEFTLTPQVGVPFLWKTVKAFVVNAIEIEPNNGGFDQIITDVTVEGLDKITALYQEIEPPICFADWDAIRLTYQADRTGNFIFFMEKDPFGFATIVENNEAVSPVGITQSNNPLVLSMDTEFAPVTFKASVVLDAANFENAKYRFCGYISYPEAIVACEYFLRHVLQNRSSSIVVPALVIGDTLTVTFNNTTFRRYLYEYLSVGETPYPVVGQTYVFEYSFTVPTTRRVDILIGAHAQNFTATFSLPIGSTSGSVTFVWVGGTSGEWSLATDVGTNMTTVGTFKFGNALCP